MLNPVVHNYFFKKNTLCVKEGSITDLRMDDVLSGTAPIDRGQC